MGKILVGDGSYACFDCGTPSNVPYGECPQCAIVKIQRDAAKAAQERFERESQQRESQYRQSEMANSPSYSDVSDMARFRRFCDNGFIIDEDFPNTPQGQAAKAAHKPIRDKVIAERTAKGLPAVLNQPVVYTANSSFAETAGFIIGNLIGFAGILFCFWLMFAVLSYLGSK